MEWELRLKTTDQNEMQDMLDAPMVMAMIRTFDEEMRHVVKHGHDPVSAHHARHWMDKLRELAQDYEVKIW